MNRSLLVAVLILLMAGCEMAGEAKNMSTSGASAYSCDQIYSAFAAYDADRQSFDALSTITGMTGLVLTQTASMKADTYYEKVRDNANIVLIVKGCKPI